MECAKYLRREEQNKGKWARWGGTNVERAGLIETFHREYFMQQCRHCECAGDFNECFRIRKVVDLHKAEGETGGGAR